MANKYQIFVSSTYEDLKDERKAVVQSILETKNIPTGMEMFQASDRSQWDIIKRVIDDCDIFLLIVAGRYGSTQIDEYGNEVSYVEMEYDYAVKINKPIISFVYKNFNEIKYGKTDRDSDKANKLKDFIENKVKVGRVIREWRNISELKNIVYAAITSMMQDSDFVNNAVGWIRGDSIPNLEKCSIDEFSGVISKYLINKIHRDSGIPINNELEANELSYSYNFAKDVANRMKSRFLDLYSTTTKIVLLDDGIKVETSRIITYIDPCSSKFIFNLNPMFRLDNPYNKDLKSTEFETFKITLFDVNNDILPVKDYYFEGNPKPTRKNPTYVEGKGLHYENEKAINTIRVDFEYTTKYNTFLQAKSLEYMCRYFKVNATLEDRRKVKKPEYYLKINIHCPSNKENNIILDKMIHTDNHIEMVDGINWASIGTGYMLVLGHRNVNE